MELLDGVNVVVGIALAPLVALTALLILSAIIKITFPLRNMLNLAFVWLVWRVPKLAVVYGMYEMVKEKPRETILFTGAASYLRNRTVLEKRLKSYFQEIIEGE